jgi:hypothetical protein
MPTPLSNQGVLQISEIHFDAIVEGTETSQLAPMLRDSFNARQRLVSVKRRWRG